MSHFTCGNCGAVRPLDFASLTPAIMEALRDHPDTQQAWVSSRLIAEKGAQKLGRAKLNELLEEQERVEPNDLNAVYWSWIMTLGIGRALAKLDKEEGPR